VKVFSIFLFCILAAALTLGAAPKPMTFESPMPPWCEDNGNQQPCIPWRPTPMPLPTSEPMRQSGQGQSLAQPAVQPGALPVTLPNTGGEPVGWMISIALVLVGIGVVLVGIRGRNVVRVNLAALLEQVGPCVLGGDERLRLLSIIRNISPDQTVTIDLSRCGEKK
jgi:LPXTG-motif cell wall-anchored protein